MLNLEVAENDPDGWMFHFRCPNCDVVLDRLKVELQMDFNKDTQEPDEILTVITEKGGTYSSVGNIREECQWKSASSGELLHPASVGHDVFNAIRKYMTEWLPTV